MRKSPMWRKRERNYVWTPDRWDKRHEFLLGDPKELDEIRRELREERAAREARRRDD